MTHVIFLGPSLPLAEARQRLDAVYLPPARQSDVLSAITRYRPDVIGLIDGEFGQSLSVWHKEIIYALEQGIAVYGASSMGALRAAETDRYGMVGIGRIYEMYASGELTDDDEVALAYGPEDTGYRHLSEPMVNLRATFRHAHESGLVDGAACDRLIAIAKELFFPDRTFARVLHEAAAAGLAAETLARLRVFLREQYVDVKRDDARLLLDAVRDHQPDRRPAPVRLCRTHLFQTLYNRDRRVPHRGVEVPLEAIANYAALNLADFNALNAHALNRALVLVLADLLDVPVTDTDVAKELRRFRVRRRLEEDDDLRAWMNANDLTQEEFDTFIGNLATCRVLQRWLVARKYMEGTTKIVLDELRLEGRYEEVADAAAEQEAILDEEHPLFRQTSFSDLSMQTLVVDHLRATACRPDRHYAAWSEEAGFQSVDDLRVELLRSRLAREYTAQVMSRVTDALQPGPPA
jgi:hypothetical protein